MRNLFLSSLISLSLASCGTPAFAGDGGADCNQFTGHLAITWPESPTEHIQGIMVDFVDDNRFTYFDVNGVEYVVQDPNVSGHVDYEQCTFNLTFNGDPIFHDGFEDTADCHRT